MSEPAANLPGIRPTDKWNKENNPGLRVSKKCKVCMAGDQIRNTVNKLLISGMGYSEVHKTIQPLCKAMGVSISYDSIRNHQQIHLPYDAVAIQEIVRRRAEETQKDFADGTQTVISAVSYAESMMTKGFFKLVDEKTDVSPMEGLAAAQFLNKMLKDQEAGATAASLLHQLDRILEAIKAVVPEVYWAKITDYLQQRETPGLTGVRVQVVDVDSSDSDLDEMEDDEVYDPITEPDDDD